ncbi:hypothetical protein NPIL_449601 [Nephila pilipes]|uniref:Uncharacterized protein n=1 Tax=Nephila pilipes TaxID=299642 RepID=A0A8X6PTA4_NEPPI|nr:hypothetical protein NPIL_449601 [Nephila pilipes]
MDPKIKDKTGEKKKPKKMISMEAKHETIAKQERGVRIFDLANKYVPYSFAKSMIRMQSFDNIRDHQAEGSDKEAATFQSRHHYFKATN